MGGSLYNRWGATERSQMVLQIFADRAPWEMVQGHEVEAPELQGQQWKVDVVRWYWGSVHDQAPQQRSMTQ